jgi:hypothetical protein
MSRYEVAAGLAASRQHEERPADFADDEVVAGAVDEERSEGRSDVGVGCDPSANSVG